MAREKKVFNDKTSQRIREARNRLGMSRQQLADNLLELSLKSIEYKDIPCSLSSVKSWEGIGEKIYSPDFTTLRAISEVLNVDFRWLYIGTDEDIAEIIKHTLMNNINTSRKDGTNHEKR